MTSHANPIFTCQRLVFSGRFRVRPNSEGRDADASIVVERGATAGAPPARISPTPISFCISVCARRWPTARAIASCAACSPRPTSSVAAPAARSATTKSTTTSPRSRCGSTARGCASPARRCRRPRIRVRCGEAIGRALAADDLAGIFVLSDGLNVNGSELVAGITGVVGAKIPLTGGLAGDSALFEETLVGADCAPQSGRVAAIGFYGTAIRIGHGSAGGWDEFGPRRRITRSTRQCAVRTRRRAGARPLRTLSRRGRRARPARHGAAVSAADPRSGASPTRTWCGPFWRSTARRAR